MRRTISKLFVTAALAVSAFASASPASAATWFSNGAPAGTAFNATAPANKVTLTGVSAGINCSSSFISTGLLYGPSGGVGLNRVADLSPTFSTCRAGGFTATAFCLGSSINFWASSYSSPVVSGQFKAGASGGTVCTFSVPSISGCTVRLNATNGFFTPFATVTYSDSTASFTLGTTGQALTSVWSSCGTLFGSASGSAASTFTDATGAALVYRVTSTFIPNITVV